MIDPDAATPESRLRAAGHALPAAPQPRGAYAPFCRADLHGLHLVCVSGQTSRIDGRAIAGRCDAGMALDAPQRATEVAMRNALAALAAACDGDLRCVRQVVRLRGFIHATPDFTQHTAVLDAASEVLRAAFPDHSMPARSAVGAVSLPDGTWIEIEIDALVEGASIGA